MTTETLQRPVAQENSPSTEGALLSIGPVLNLTLDLESVGPPERPVAYQEGVLPFGTSLMMRATVIPGPISPRATNRTPQQRLTTTSTFINEKADTRADVDYTYDSSDPR